MPNNFFLLYCFPQTRLPCSSYNLNLSKVSFLDQATTYARPILNILH